MKIPFWTDPNDSVKVIEATKEAADKYGHRCGSDVVQLTHEHIEALYSGKMLAWNDSEYTTFAILRSEEDEDDTSIRTVD